MFFGALRMDDSVCAHCPCVNVDRVAIAVIRLRLLPDGQRMAKADQFIVEVRYAALSAEELEERRVQLKRLLLSGAIRYANLHTSFGDPHAPAASVLVSSGEK